MKGRNQNRSNKAKAGAHGVSRRSFIGRTLGLSALCLSCDLSSVLKELPFAYGRSEQQHIRVNLPQDVAVGPSGTRYVSSISEEGSYRVIAFDKMGAKQKVFGKTGSGSGELNFPQGIAVDSAGDIYVVERNNGRLSVFSEDGRFQRFIGALGKIYGRLYSPEGLCLHKDTIYVADTRNHRIQLFGENGDIQRVIGEMGDRDDQFRLPRAVAVTTAGLMYVVDSRHNYIKVFTRDGAFKTKFGGTATKAKERGLLNQPGGISLDEERNRVYVSDTMNNRIQVFDSAGTVMAVLDEEGGYFFNRPKGISLDGEDNLLVADTENNQVQCLLKDELA